MKRFVLVYLAIASCACAFIPSTQRLRRDVAELAAPPYNYLPPEQKLALPEATESTPCAEIDEEPTAPPPSAKLGDSGYEYRTVRTRKYRTRTRRDVSHLQQNYLPPLRNDYLPPVGSDDADDSVVVSAAAPKVSSDYLPPAVAETTTAVVTETDVAAEEEAETTAPAIDERSQDAGVLTADGYHYKQPAKIPDLKAAGEYLPPLNEDVVVVEAADPEETVVLADDGYHYRAIKRARF